VRLQHAEVLDKDGNFYTANLRTAKQLDSYTLKGEGDETWEPRFTFHGFRYVKVEGFPGTPTADAITGIVVHSDMPRTGTFATSDSLLNQLFHNVVWGQKGNFVGVPTDCPQRDERLGWTGDAQVFSRTAAFNYDVADSSRTGCATSPPTSARTDRSRRRSRRAHERSERCAALTRHVRGTDQLRRMGRRRGDHPVDDVPCLWRRSAPRTAVSEHARLRRVSAQDGGRPHALEYGLALRRLARLRHDPLRLPRRDHGQGSHRDGLLRTLDRSARAKRRRARQDGRRARLSRAVRPDPRGVGEGVRHRLGRLSSNTQTAYSLALEFGLLPDARRPDAARGSPRTCATSAI
jgi:hypothetical protein